MRVGLVAVLCGSACGRIGFAPSGAGAASDAATGDATDASIAPCLGSLHTISDNFDDGSFDTTVWAGTYEGSQTSLSEVGGALVVTLWMGGQDYAGAASASTFTFLPSDRVFAELVTAPPAASEGLAMLSIYQEITGTNPALEMMVQNGTLYLQAKDTSNLFTVYATMPYDPTAHRWLQMRSEGGMAYFEAAVDGVTWVELGSAPLPTVLDFTRAGVDVSGGTYAASAVAPGTVVWDNVNRGPGACP